jgi:hypothetical protein
MRRRLSSLVVRATSAASADARAPCALCAHDMLLPCAAVPCGHLCCYVCFTASCRADTEHACSVCSARVTALQRA